MIEFKLPDIGEGVAEGEIVKWLVEEGSTVSEHQALVEVMTDKATVEIPSPAAGVVAKILAAAGDTVPVGQVIFHLDDGAKTAAGPANAAKAAATPAPTGTAAPAQATGSILEFKLPDIGEGVAEGEIVKWLVEEGATVAEHQALVEVMTDKATVEVPAPAAGRLVKIVAEAGSTVPVGQVIFHLATVGAPSRAAAPAPVAVPVGAGAPVAVGAGAPARSTGRGNGKVLAVPSARRVARELGIDLARVPGTGRNGVVRRKDVEDFATRAPAAPVASVPPAAAPTATPAAPAFHAVAGTTEEQRRPFRGVRRKISEAMVRSWTNAVHFTVVEEIDVTDLVALRTEAKAIGAESGVKFTYMPFIMKAVALGLARYATLNGRLDEGTQEIVNPAYVHLGIATDTPNGLIVPVVRDVQAKGMLQLAAELQDLAERTRAGKVKPEELRGSTFTITNAGNIGGTLATPIINFPDIAILGVHRLMKRPGVVETPAGERIEPRQFMNLSLSVDHRLADGADGARFLAYLRRLLESPGLLAL